MNTKSSWVILALVIMAVLFAPLIPNDSSAECDGELASSVACDQSSAYVSIYQKYLK